MGQFNLNLIKLMMMLENKKFINILKSSIYSTNFEIKRVVYKLKTRGFLN